MPRRPARHALVTLAVLAACQEPTGTRTPPDVSVPTRALWAGSTLQLRSHSFPQDVGNTSVELGGARLPVQRTDDTTLSVLIPPDLSGSFVPRLHVAGTTVLLPSITVYGYTRSWELEPNLVWDIVVSPGTGHASVYGNSLDGLTRIDLDSRTVISYDSLGDINGMRGPGVTYDGAASLLWPVGSTTLQAWTLGSPPAFVRTYSLPITAPPRQAMQLGPQAWLISTHHFIRTYIRADSTQPYQITDLWAEETEGVHMSPRHDRATIQIDHSPSGIPVYDVPSGQVAYFLTQLQTAEGVAFSPDGEYLVVAGGIVATGTPARVLLVRSQTGQVLADTTLDRSVFSAAWDPTRPLLYLGLSQPDTAATSQGTFHPAILVLDASTLALRGELRAPESSPSCAWGCYKGALAFSAEPALYAVWAYSTPTTRSSRFALPPLDVIPGTARQGGR